MQHFFKKARPYLSQDTVIDILCHHGEWNTYVKPEKNSIRERELVEYRGMYYFVLYHFTKLSLAEIGKFFRNTDGKPKDHATILHGYKSFPDVYLKYNRGSLGVTYESVMSHINTTLQMKGFSPHLTTTKMTKREAMHYIQHQRKIMFTLVKKQTMLLDRIKVLESLSV